MGALDKNNGEIREEDDKENVVKTRGPASSIDDLYRRSTQFELWSFSAEGFDAQRRKANESGRKMATARFNKAYDELKSQQPEVFEKFADELSPEKLLDLLTYEEEVKYLNYYGKSLIQTCNHFKMPTQVKATAVSFFKKFYLVNSVSEYHPKNVLYTCVFLAAKSENYFISIESFVKPLAKVSPSDILDLEFIVLQSLKFTLLVHHPFRPLYGFFLDLQAVLLHPSPLMYDVSIDTLGGLYDKAKKWLNDYYLLSDVAFLFTPPQIALAAMYDIDKRIIDRYLKRKFLKDQPKEEAETTEPPDHYTDEPFVKQQPVKEEPKEPAEVEDPENKENKPATPRENYEYLVKTIRKCIKIAKSVEETSREESKNIDKKCFFTLNPRRLIEKRINKLSNPA